MFSYVLSTASVYLHSPLDEKLDEKGNADIPCSNITNLAHVPGQASPNVMTSPQTISEEERNKTAILAYVLQQEDLYAILGVSKNSKLDKVALRRAYLSRSKACHPDKFPDNRSDATSAFQKIAVAYDVLSNPSSKRAYDSRSPTSNFDVFATRPTTYGEDTFRTVIISIFNDFLDGDLEVVRTLLKAVNDANPSLRLGDDGITSVLATMQSIRQRALTCRTCVYALHSELCRLLEVQHRLRQLSYFDLFGRSSLSIELARIAITLPIALDRAFNEGSVDFDADYTQSSLPKHMVGLLQGVDNILERLERILKPRNNVTL